MSYAHSRSLSGYLKKKGLGGWKTRFCVLSETVLFYFKKEEDATLAAQSKGEKPDGSLSCLGCGVYKEADPLFAFSLVLAQSKKKAVFQAPTAEDAEAWVRELKRVSGRVIYTLDNPAEFHKADKEVESAVHFHSEGQRSAEEPPSVALHYDFDAEQTETAAVVSRSLERAPSDVELDSDSEADEDGRASEVTPTNAPHFPSSSPTASSSSSSSSSSSLPRSASVSSFSSSSSSSSSSATSSIQRSSSVSSFSSSSSSSSSTATSTFLPRSSSHISIDSEDDPPPPPPFEIDPNLSPQSRRRSLLANAPSKNAPPRAKVTPKSPKILPVNPKIPFNAPPDRQAPRLPEKKPTLAQIERGLVAAPVEEEVPNFMSAARLAGMIKSPRISVHTTGSDSDSAHARKSSLTTTTLHTRSPTPSALSAVADGSSKTGETPLITPKGGDFIAARRGRIIPSPRMSGTNTTPITITGSTDDEPLPPPESDEDVPPPPSTPHLQIELSTSGSPMAPSLPVSPAPSLSPHPTTNSFSATPSPDAVNIHAGRPALPKFGGVSPPPLPAFSGNSPLPATLPAAHTPSPILTLTHRPRSASSAIVAEASEKGLFKQLLAKPPPRRRSFKYPESSFTSSPPLPSNDPTRPSPPSQPHYSFPPRTEAGPLPSGPQILPHRMSRSSMVMHIDDRRLSRGSVSRGGVYAGYCKILKGRLRKKWENRYFTLDFQTRSLLYRESWDSQLTQKRRIISLVSAHVSAVERFREHGYCWMIQTPRRSYFICAFTPEDQMEWVRAITSLLQGANPDPPPPDDEPVPIDIEQFRASPLPTSPEKPEEEDPIVVSWLAWEATQKELEYQRELTLFLLEINQDDFTGRERRQVRFTAGENLMAPKLLYEPPPSEAKGKAELKGELKGEVSFTPELARLFAKHLDCGRMVWLHVSGGILQYSLEGEALVEGDLLSAYEQKCPPGQTNTNFEVVGKQFLSLETGRHQVAQTLLGQPPQEVVFAALLCRHLRRPEDGVRRAVLGSSLSWMSNGHAADALFSLQTLFGWLVANQVLRSDLCSVWDTAAKGVPQLDLLYNQCFGISVIAGMKHIEDRRFFSHSQRPEGVEKKEVSPSRARDSVTSLIDPSRICFRENGTPIKEAQVAAKISQALQVGLFVVFAITKHREVEFLVECREDALDLREAWSRWKAPFERLPAQLMPEIFPRIIPAWAAFERARYDAMALSVSSLFGQAPVLLLSRFMQQSPDMVKPPVFGDMLLKWLPAREVQEEAPLKWHSNRLMDWLVDNQVVGNYTVQISSQKKLELPTYDRMYHQLFLAAPLMFTSLSSPATPSVRPASNATLSSRSVFAAVLQTPPACFASYLSPGTSPTNVTTATATTSLASPSADSPLPPTGKLTPRSGSQSGSQSGAELTPRSSSYTTPKPGSRTRVKKQSVVLSEDSSDSGDEGYRNPAERAWAEGRLSAAFAAFPLTESPMDKEQIMSICIELATDGLQETETSRFVSLLTGGECPSLGAMLYDFVDKTGGHEPSESEVEEGDEEEAGAAEAPTPEPPRTSNLAEF